MARRSARIASASKTPNKLDGGPALGMLAEHDESPKGVAAAPQSLNAVLSSPAPGPKTPAASTPAKPPMSEMHPSKVHPTMGPPSSGLRLGFTDIKLSTRGEDVPGGQQSTPSKAPATSSPPFSFRYTRDGASSDLKLGPEALRMMDELRSEASKIKADLAAQRELEQETEEQVGSRKFAKAKGKAGRFSAAHMAEFKKMDSIENHPSAFRAQAGRAPLASKGIKRTQSKANLNEPETPRVQRTPQVKTLTTVTKVKTRTGDEPSSPVKRMRQEMDEDVSDMRPASRDASFLPRPTSAGKGSTIPRSKSTFASLMTPTKSSLARTASTKTPGQKFLLKSPSTLSLAGLPQSTTTNNLTSKVIQREVEEPQIPLRTPSGRFEKVKSLLRGTRFSTTKAKSAIPVPGGLSKTPAPPRTNKELPPAPFTTPRHLAPRPILFTPAARKPVLAQNSPSPVKSSIPLSKSRRVLGEVHYPSLDEVMAGSADVDMEDMGYPDLSEHGVSTKSSPQRFEGEDGESAPTAFTFRSEHKMRFGSASPQATLSSQKPGIRHVRPSLPGGDMPGSFPVSTVSPISVSPDKENQMPPPNFPAVPHGMTNKKRHRVNTDEQDAEEEAAARAAKKRRQETVPEDANLFAPDLLASATKKKPATSPRKLMSPGFARRTPSPKKKSGMSLSRLNMLARPKMRK